MKEFSQYTSAEEFLRDLITEGIFPRNKKVQAAFPNLAVVRPATVERLKVAIVDAIKNRPIDVTMSLSRLARRVRSDNHPDEFKIAIKQLIEERKITEEKMVTGKIGRPFIHYNLFEF